jgi:hypothetical protein
VSNQDELIEEVLAEERNRIGTQLEQIKVQWTTKAKEQIRILKQGGNPWQEEVKHSQ